ncbi:MAG: hypothetical protein RIF41_10640, partial [Polyangiaceae bacterium]
MDARAVGAIGLLLAAVACDEAPPQRAIPSASAAATGAPTSVTTASASAIATVSAPAPAPPVDRRPLHLTTQPDLLALLPPFPEEARAYVDKHVKPGGFGAMNQGN